LPAETAIIYFHPFTTLPPATHHKKAVNNNSKSSPTLPCSRTVTSQQQFGGQHGVLHDIEGQRKAPYFERERRQ